MQVSTTTMPVVIRVVSACCIVAFALAAGACAKASADVVPDGPPLQMPEPPLRVLAPVEEPVVIEPIPEPEAPPAAAAAPRTPPRAPAGPRPAPVAAQPEPPAPAPPTEMLELRTALPAAAVTERGVRDTLARALRDINRVNYSRLSADGRAQYEQSRRFGVQAEDALRERNLIFAATLADKAATLAAELAAGR